MNESVISLTRKYEQETGRSIFGREFYCEITTQLDELSGIIKEYPASDDDYNFAYRHYILADDWALENKLLAIRIPGGTLGSIRYDDDYVITSIGVDLDYVIGTYPKNINETLKELYVGKKLDLTNVTDKEEADE